MLGLKRRIKMADGSQARKDKIATAHGRPIVCPKCGSGQVSINLLDLAVVDIFTCKQCGCRFDSDGSTGPFTVKCSECSQENPWANERCFMCHGSLDAEKLETQKPDNIVCSNCQTPNRGAGRCIRCGQQISGSGEVVSIKKEMS